MVSDDSTDHYIIRLLSAREIILLSLLPSSLVPRCLVSTFTEQPSSQVSRAYFHRAA